MEPTYLGDSVYVRFDGYHYIVYLDNGEGPHNEIMMETEVVEKLLAFRESVKERFGQ